ncbi:MAG: hypothetical protein ACREOY_08120 [Candidatus Dormibacteraceae bacterium]
MTSFAVLAAVVVVAGFMATQFPARPAPPIVVTSPSPIAVDYGPPPPGVPLIWVQDPNHSGWLIGFDWTGKLRGTVKVSRPVAQYDRLSQAPDGSAFGIEPNGKGGFQVFLDGLGATIATSGPQVLYQSEMWADDSRHLCDLDPSSGRWTLGLAVPGAAPNPVNEIALDPSSLARSGIIAFSFGACSARNDRAVIPYSYPGRPTAYSVVRISDGAILQQRTYAAGLVANVTASMDGSLIAESSGQSAGEPPPNATSTVIRRASDLSVVSTLAPNIGVLAFSGDNSAALVSTAPLIGGQAAMLEVLDLQTGRVTWTGEGTSGLGAVAVQPTADAFAVALTQPGEQNSPATILIIFADGSRPAKLPGLLVPIW